ncbi:MAG: aspartate/glutamate racemase family protein [Pseudonocardia sp.]|nr:aspartate/glutamate racemase family protein [Pseudonocardia sp.]
MGPAATAEFYAKLIRRTPAVRDQDHLRVAIWADPTVPDRVAAAINGSAEPYPALLAGALRLRDIGATEIVIPCHTAHVFMPNLARDTGVPFIDMVHETVAELTRRERPGALIGLLGTRGTIHTDLYQARLRAAQLDVAVPDEAMQDHVDIAIKKVKEGDFAAAGQHLRKVVDALAGQGASPIVLACTELPLAVPCLPVPEQMELLDPTDLLADAVVRVCLGDSR